MIQTVLGNPGVIQIGMFIAAIFCIQRFRAVRKECILSGDKPSGYLYVFFLLFSIPLLSVTNTFFRFYGRDSVSNSYQLGVSLSMLLIVLPLLLVRQESGSAFSYMDKPGILNYDNFLLLIVFLGGALGIAQGLVLQQSWIQSLFVVAAFSLATKFNHNWTPRIYLQGGYLSLFVILVALGLKIVFVEPLASCRTDKCTFSPLVLSGNQNGLGILILFIGLLLFCYESRKYDPGIIFSTGLLLLISASRTSILCFAALTLLKLCVNPLSNLRKRFLLKGVVFFSFALSLVPFLNNWTENELTFRGVLWNTGKAFFQESWIIGNGPSFWVRLGRQYSFDANYGTHNIWLDAAVAQGIIGLFCLSAFLYVLYRKICLGDNFLLMIPFSSVLITGFSESVFSLTRYSFAIPIFLLLVQASKKSLPR